tara:strand:- start:343 stop:1464 length:1122 start_codon:yes stop_codon:yes gene_type:complete
MKFFRLFFLLLLIWNCSSPTTINDSKLKNDSRKIIDSFTFKDVDVEIFDINKMLLSEIKEFNNIQINNLDYSIHKFKEIYDYRYEYSLDASDVISINLTDTDELDNTYTLDTTGNIDLPFIGKINLAGLTLKKAEDQLLSILKKYYKNPELQVEINEFNSSKIYVLGAVKNQLSINLDEKPIKLIDAAIQASYSPNSQSKENGSKGILRRNNKVYKIDFNNVFQNLDNKENFYLKKDDVLFIDNNAEALHVFGEVKKPGIYFPNYEYSITELLSVSGINNLTANAKKIYVIREDYNKVLKINIFQLDIRKPINLVIGKKFLLKPKDIIFIPAKPIVKWNRTISLLLPQTDLFNSYNPIVQNGVKQGTSANVTE